MQIKKFEAVHCRMVSQEIEDLLKPLAERFGIHIKTGGGTYSPTNFTLKVECATIDPDTGEAETKEARDFKLSARRYGLEPSDLGREFMHDGYLYKVIGCKPRSRKFPILAKRQVPGGHTLKFPAATIKLKLSTAASRAARSTTAA